MKLKILSIISVIVGVCCCTPSPYLTVTQNKISFPANGGSHAVPFKANMYWSASSDVSWLTVTPDKGDPVSSIVTIKVVKNNTYGEREGTVTIKVEDKMSKITVTQAQNDSVIIPKTAYEVPSSGGVVSVNILYNMPYTIDIKDNWITQTKSLTSKDLSFIVAENPEKYSSRTGIILVKSGDVTQTITIKQLQKDAVIVSQKVYNIPVQGEIIDVGISSNVQYSVIIPQSCKWIKESVSKELVDNTHKFIIEANNTYSHREEMIIFKGKNTDAADTVTIKQDQTNYLALEKKDLMVNYEERTVEVKISGNIPYEFDVENIASSWLSVIKTKAIDDFYAKISIASFNGSDSEIIRNGRIFLRNKEKSLYDTLYVSQTAKGVYYIKKVHAGELMSEIGATNYSDVKKLVVSGTVYESDIKSIKTNLVNLEYLDISDIKYPSSGMSIPYNCFSEMVSLRTIKIPDNVTSIGSGAFMGCTSLKYINAPYDLKSIESGAFSGCSSLASFIIAEGVSKIASAAFNGCSSLVSITIPSKVSRIEYNTFKDCSSLGKINLPSSVVYIGNNAFSGCSSLNSVKIPEKVSEIGNGAFENCSSLTSASSLANVSSLGSAVFKGCKSLLRIELPKEIESIPMNLLYGCESLSQIICKATIPPSIQYNAFYNVNKENCLLYVPASSAGTYKVTAGWKDFKKIIDL